MIKLKKKSFEKLIKQLIFLEESCGDIKDHLVAEKLFSSKPDVQKFLNAYTAKVESIFAHIVIADSADDFAAVHKNLFPFIVIDSCFTLRDRMNNNIFCRLTSDLYENSSEISHSIYAFSASGLNLMLREKGDLCSVNLGSGFDEYIIDSISLY